MPRKILETGNGDTVNSDLPTCTGSSMDLFPWRRELNLQLGLLDPELGYFLTTSAAVTSQGKVAVMDIHHSILLRSGLISSAKYNILNLVPMDDFATVYAEKLKLVQAGEIETKGGFILPEKPELEDLPVMHVIAPHKIMLVDMKLKTEILKLITSPGRRKHYMNTTGPSGIELLKVIEEDCKITETKYSQNPYYLKIKAQIAEVMSMRLTRVSLDEFNEIKDTLEDLNSQLKEKEGLSEMQLSEHYLTLISDLECSSLESKLDTDMCNNKVEHGDLSKTTAAITRCLAQHMARLDIKRMSIANKSARAMNAAPPPVRADPRKNFTNRPTTPCPVCGSMKHWKQQCYQNPNADEETKKRAPRSSPAGKAWSAQQGKNNNTYRSVEKTEDKQACAGTATYAAEDPLERAFDSTEGDTIVVGRAALARFDGVYVDDAVYVDCELCSDQEEDTPPPYALPPPMHDIKTVSYTHLTLPTNREV